MLARVRGFTTRVNDTFVVSCVNNTVSRGFDINPFRGQKDVLLKQQFQTLSFEQINERRCQIFWSCTILNPKFILYTFIYIYLFQLSSPLILYSSFFKVAFNNLMNECKSPHHNCFFVLYTFSNERTPLGGCDCCT